jgi:putative PIN family toxin of toxin-antitoxin system
MRLVLDTNVVASAMLWTGPPRELLLAARDGKTVLFTSIPLLGELTRILSRSKFETKVAASMLTIGQLVEAYADLCTVVRPSSVPRIASDPDDDVVIGTALAASADAVVTGDKPLLALGRYEMVSVLDVRRALLAILINPAAESP